MARTDWSHAQHHQAPAGAARLPDPFHKRTIYTTCREGMEIRAETDTEFTYIPPPPAKATESKEVTTTRIIHTERKCPEDKGAGSPGPATSRSTFPLPPPPDPPAKDRHEHDREIQAEFDRQWERAAAEKPK